MKNRPILSVLAYVLIGSRSAGADGERANEGDSSPRAEVASFENSLGMQFVPVPISGGRELLFSVWDTRVQDYEVFARETNRAWPKPEFSQGPTHPAVMVSWLDAQAFCAWLTDRERQTGILAPDKAYRLPTDYEWSCAAGIGGREDPAKLPVEKKGRITDVFPWGGVWPPPSGAGNYAGAEMGPALAAGRYGYIKEPIAGYRDGFVNTSPVGKFAANQFHLFDLGGNVWQWCEDWYDGTAKYRVLRGASWNDSVRGHLLSSNRAHDRPDYQGYDNGFRCVLSKSSP